MNDLGDVLAVFSAYSVEQVGRILLEETELQAEWKIPTFSLETNTCVVIAPDGRLVGYAAMFDSVPHVRPFAQVRVHPEFTGESIGTYLAWWAERRAQQALLKAPEGTRIALQRVFSIRRELH
jgi:N-acetylglutamate synthase-like GNAT family acetyltransferase